MWNARLEEAQAGIKIAGRNINHLRYADDTTFVAESEELKSLLMEVKEESEKAGLKLNTQKTKIMVSGPTTLWQTETVTDFILLGSQITADGDCSHEIKRRLLMAPHSSTLAWKITWTEEPGRLQSMGSLRVGQRLNDFTLTFHFHALDKDMATPSSIFA